MGSGSMLQGGILTYRMTDFVDYKIPAAQGTDYIGQYGVAPFNTIPGMFGTGDADLNKFSPPAVRLRRVNLSVLPLGAAANPEALVFTVRSGCPVSYPSADNVSNLGVTMLWNQQATLVTPTVNPRFVRVATWDFDQIPNGAVPQVVNDTTDDTKAVMGVFNFQVLNVNSDTQYYNTDGAFNMQFRVDIEFDLPMPSVSQVRTYTATLAGNQYFRSFNPDAEASDANCYVIVKGYRRTTETLPNINTSHGLRAIQHLATIEEEEDEAGAEKRCPCRAI